MAAAFVHAALGKPQGAQVCNFVGETARVDDVLAEIRRIVPDACVSAEGPPLPIAIGQSEAELDAFFPNRPRTSLAEGLALTIAHYRAIDSVRRVPA